jgi:hypothetical protein
MTESEAVPLRRDVLQGNLIYGMKAELLETSPDGSIKQ